MGLVEVILRLPSSAGEGLGDGRVLDFFELGREMTQRRRLLDNAQTSQ